MAPLDAERDLVEHGRYDSPFFRSKFRVPSAPPHFVVRPRLVRLLDDLAEYPVTALVAPAGAGKTALAAAWVGAHPGRAAWLTLDGSDCDPGQLLTAVAAALEPLAPGCSAWLAGAARGRDGALGGAYALVDALERGEPEHAILVIDDVHLIDEDAAATSIFEAFVEHRPSWLSLLLVSRRQLPLAVDRLRGGGVLADVTFDALRFSHGEAMELLTATCAELSPQELSPLAEWADGWAAALQLAALTVRSRGGQAAALDMGARHAPDVRSPSHADDLSSASDRHVDSYLWHEVLRTERPETISILLSVAVVGRANYSLAEAVTGRADAGQLLAEAEARGLFVTKLESGGWFEVHGLVRGMLLSELERRWPQRLEELHRRAARWFESADDTISALDHWLAAGEPRQALRLLFRNAFELYESGRQAVVVRVVAAIPRPSAGADLEALVEYAWCALFVGRDEFASALRAAEGAAELETGNPRMLVLRSVAALLAGSWQECEADARSALDEFGGQPWADELGRLGWSLVAHGVALDERWDHAEPAVHLAQLGVDNDAEQLIAFEGTRALGLALAGYPLEALQATAGVKHFAATAELVTLRSELALASAMAARELGDRGQAQEALGRLAAEGSHLRPFVQLAAQLELVELELSGGRVERADAMFELATENQVRNLPGHGAGTWLARHGVVLALAHGDVDGAQRWTDRIEDSFWRPVSEARTAVATGRIAVAAESLARCEPRNARHVVIQNLLMARADVCDREQAAKHVVTALELAADRGMLQTVGSEGRGLRDLIELAAWRVPDGWMDRLRRVVLPDGVPSTAPTHVMLEELTTRELEVLRLLPTRLTVREIAAELFVSHNTLKFHLRVIYQKLGVNTRADAVTEARAHGLLGRA
ncbi:MAG: LuxR C-terminal-related transcriptional regulator [Brevundimonas sp.]